jgi:hypothetical protein
MSKETDNFIGSTEESIWGDEQRENQDCIVSCPNCEASVMEEDLVTCEDCGVTGCILCVVFNSIANASICIDVNACQERKLEQDKDM